MLKSSSEFFQVFCWKIVKKWVGQKRPRLQMERVKIWL